MRSLGAGIATQVAGVITRPIWLAQIQFTTGTVYHTTGNDVSFSSNSYTNADFTVSGIRWRPGGATAITLKYSDADSAIKALVLANTSGEKITVWVSEEGAIAAGVLASGDAVQVFDGVIDSTDISGSVTMNCKATGAERVFSPRVFATPDDGFNNNTPAGEGLQIGPTTFNLKASR